MPSITKAGKRHRKPDGLRRTRLVKVLFTPGEYEDISMAAEATGHTDSAFLRWRGLEAVAAILAAFIKGLCTDEPLDAPEQENTDDPESAQGERGR